MINIVLTYDQLVDQIKNEVKQEQEGSTGKNIDNNHNDVLKNIIREKSTSNTDSGDKNNTDIKTTHSIENTPTDVLQDKDFRSHVWLSKLTIADELDGKTKWQLLKLLCKYKHIFSQSLYDIGRISIAEHVIDTGSSPPINQYPYRMGQ